MAWSDEDLTGLLARPMPAPGPGFAAQVVASGPTSRHSAMPEMFQSLIYAARRELVITTPYYVPDEALQDALCAAANRGVATTIVFPARNATGRSPQPAAAIMPTCSPPAWRSTNSKAGCCTPRRSRWMARWLWSARPTWTGGPSDLNYENNILLVDGSATAALRARQAAFIARSRPVRAEEVAAWPWQRRLWNNAVALMARYCSADQGASRVPIARVLSSIRAW